jgi:hypothetical protein
VLAVMPAIAAALNDKLLAFIFHSYRTLCITFVLLQA